MSESRGGGEGRESETVWEKMNEGEREGRRRMRVRGERTRERERERERERSYLCISHEHRSSIVLQSSRPGGRIQLKLFLHIFVICLLQPGAVEDAVVMVTHGPQQGGGRVSKVVCESKLRHQFSKKSTEAACSRKRQTEYVAIDLYQSNTDYS